MTLHRTLVEQDRAFDVECVRSAVNFINRIESSVEGEEANAASAFAWLPQVLRERAQRFEIRSSNVPTQIESLDVEVNRRVARYFMISATYAQTRERELAMAQAERDPKRRAQKLAFRKQVDEWLDAALKYLPIYERVRLIEGRVVRVSLPVLRDVGSCLAYALMVLIENRWGMQGRVRECRYGISPGGTGPNHWFLDYRLDKGGRLKRGSRREFCTPAHANSFHQREWRRRQAERTQTQMIERTRRRKTAGG